jgi:hypothetical protein
MLLLSDNKQAEKQDFWPHIRIKTYVYMQMHIFSKNESLAE